MDVLAIFKRVGNLFEFIALPDSGALNIDFIEYAKGIDSARCDICQKRINRTTLFLAKDEDGSIKQVGRSCLKNVNSEVVEMLEGARGQADFDDEYMLFRAGFRKRFDGKKCLNILYQAYELNGFKKMNYNAFLDIVTLKNREHKAIKYCPEYDEKVEALISYLTEKLRNTRNDFLYKLWVYLQDVGGLKAEHFGILQYAIKIYFDELSRDKKALLNAGEYLQAEYGGEVFKIKQLIFRHVKEMAVGSRWSNRTAVSYIYYIITDKNQVLELSTSNALKDLDAYIGKAAKANSKGKSYKSFDYGTVSLVNRLKVID